MNVYDHFEQSFPDHLGLHEDASLRYNLVSMPLDSTCGDGCKAAIDAASVFVYHVRQAYGDDRPDLIIDIAKAAAATVQCFICG